MNFVSVFMAVFSVIGAIDLIIGNRFGLGKEFEKGFMLFGNVALSMIGMIVLAPFLGELMMPISNWLYKISGIDPSILPAMLFANDMGGFSLAESMGKNETLALFNGLVVSSMMGCTISFTIPVSLGIIKPNQHKYAITGFLCGIITIPVGCLVSGLIIRISIGTLLLNLLPMIIFSIIISCGILFAPKVCIKIFSVIGVILKVMIILGLILGILKSLTGLEIIKGLDSLEAGGLICFNACVVMSGAFPFLAILSKIAAKPLKLAGKKLKINEVSAFGFFSSLATSITTFKEMERMDNKGVVLNSAFAISGAFTFAGHLAFTLSLNSGFVWYVIIGKLISGISAIILSVFVYKKFYSAEKENPEENEKINEKAADTEDNSTADSTVKALS